MWLPASFTWQREDIAPGFLGNYSCIALPTASLQSCLPRCTRIPAGKKEGRAKHALQILQYSGLPKRDVPIR